MYKNKNDKRKKEYNIMRGFKAFNEDLTSHNGFQYEIGETYEINEDPIPCKRGFHFCESIAGCYQFYSEADTTRICEVEALGTIIKADDTKLCTDKIRIIKEIPLEDIKKIVNTGDNNIGYFNTGNSNSGYRNSGDHNDGGRNTGDANVGYRNSGDYNDGFRNTGDHNDGFRNSGDHNGGDYNTGNYNSGSNNTGNYNGGRYNTGSHNTGNYNSGYYNAGNHNTGVFCTHNNPTIKLFDKESQWTYENWEQSVANSILKTCPQFKEGTNYVPTTSEDKQKWWESLSDSDKQIIYNIPNFDAEKFYLCTRIKVYKEK